MPKASKDMPRLAKVWIAAVITAGAAVGVSAVLDWQCASLPRFWAMLVLAIAGGAVKARLPGMTGTYSASFVFVLAAVPGLSLSEMVAVAAGTAAVQNFWRSRTKVRPVQLLFNVSNLILSTALADAAYGSGTYAVAQLTFAVVVYWAVNTGILSVVLTLVGEGQFLDLWRRWCLYSLPFHLGGGAVAILLSEPLSQGDWRAAVVFAPVVVFAAKYYRAEVSRVAH
jgi:hypothetical protein